MMSTNNIPVSGGDPFAGFWRRAAAFLIDFVLIQSVYLLITYFVWGDLAARVEAVYADVPTGSPLNDVVLPEPLGEELREAILLGLLLLGVLTMAYYAFLESSRAQATLGKRLMRIRVCDFNGDKINLLTAGYRAWPLWLPSLINTVWILDIVVGIAAVVAFLSVAFTKRKQGLHDVMSRCLVVKRRAVFSDAPGQQT